MKIKSLSFLFKNYNDYSNKNILPIMKGAKANKEINFSYNQEESNKRILRKINNKYFIKQFNLYGKKSNNKFTNKRIKNISDELFNSTKTFSRNRKSNFKTQNNFYKNSKKDLLYYNLLGKNNYHEEEKVYDFRQKFSKQKNKIIELRNEYKFYNPPTNIKEEISKNIIKKVFSNEFIFDLNNKYNPKKRIIAKLKKNSLSEKLHLDCNEAKNIEKKLFKIKNKNKNKAIYSNHIIDIHNFINNDLKKMEYFKSLSNSDFKLKLEIPVKKKTNIFFNRMNYPKTSL